jgi:hypothetical protein
MLFSAYSSQCECGSALINGGGKALPESSCNSKCAADSTQICGPSILFLYPPTVGSRELNRPPFFHVSRRNLGSFPLPLCQPDRFQLQHCVFFRAGSLIFFRLVVCRRLLDRCLRLRCRLGCSHERRLGLPWLQLHWMRSGCLQPSAYPLDQRQHLHEREVHRVLLQQRLPIRRNE